MKILELKLKAPTAQFRIPFLLNERRTYPIPQFSTAIGIICNVLKEKERINKFLTSDVSMAIIGNYDSITMEYTWDRNLSRESHKKRFNSVENRIFQGEIEHPGGQSPGRHQVLIGVEVRIFVKSSDDVLDIISDSLKRGGFINHIHLGRAEDIVSDVEVKFHELSLNPVFNTSGYTWIPFPEYADESIKSESYNRLFKKIIATAHMVSTVYRIENGLRIFESVEAKLYNGFLPMTTPTEPPVFPSIEDGTPIFLTRVVRA